MKQELTPFQEQIRGIDIIDRQIRALCADGAYKPYIIANQLEKLAKAIQKDFKHEFQAYYDQNRELPYGFECRITTRTTYDFTVDEEWCKLNEQLKAREEVLKNATDQQLKGNVLVDQNGEVIFGVPVKQTEVYSITKK